MRRATPGSSAAAARSSGRRARRLATSRRSRKSPTTATATHCSCACIRRASPAIRARTPPAKKADLAAVLYDLYNVIQDRRLNPVEGSYTNYLFEKGQDKILKKVGEEAVETIIASKNNVRKEILYEMGDLWYHCLVLLAYHNISPEELFAELMGRRKGASYHKFTGKTGVRPDL